ncbi:unnamed protein product [Cuscuta europaea]|uniref:Uncharacterized protein n=1 Tax=Cuscuta europaea TaxID=41803 RepID=A0A9P0ZUX7_CUSEU|nr:unnamed protein product [Cuscuta europaea]
MGLLKGEDITEDKTVFVKRQQPRQLKDIFSGNTCSEQKRFGPVVLEDHVYPCSGKSYANVQIGAVISPGGSLTWMKVVSCGRLVMDDKEAETAIYNKKLTGGMHSSTMFKAILKPKVEEELFAPYILKEYEDYSPVVSSAIVNLDGKSSISCDSLVNLEVDLMVGELRITDYITEKTAESYVEQNMEDKEKVKGKQNLKMARSLSGIETACLQENQIWRFYIIDRISYSIGGRTADGIGYLFPFLLMLFRPSLSNEIGQELKEEEVGRYKKELTSNAVLVSEDRNDKELQKREEFFSFFL